MMQDDLKRLLSEIPAAPLAGSLSDDALEALSHICVSVHDMMVGDDLDGEYGDRKEYERLLDCLYGICRDRCGSSESVSRRARLLPTLYELLHRPMRVPDPGRSSECRERMCRLVGEWMQAPGEGESGVLRCIAYLLCYEPEESREREPAYGYFRSRIGEWTESLFVAGGVGPAWPGVSEEETLERVLVLSLASDLLGVPVPSGPVESLGRMCALRVTDRIRTALGERGEGLEAVAGYSRADADARLLYLCYEASMWGVGVADGGTVESLVSCVRVLHGRSARGSAARLWSLAVLSDAACREIGKALEDEYFAHIA